MSDYRALITRSGTAAIIIQNNPCNIPVKDISLNKLDTTNLIASSDHLKENVIFLTFICHNAMARRRIVGRGRVADMLQTAIRREAGRAASLLERDVEDLYAIIGSQLAAIQVATKLARVRIPPRVNKREFILQRMPVITELPRDEGRKFVESCWSKIVDRACRWWNENREKFSGKDAKTIIRSLAPEIALAIPAKLRAGSIAALTAALLVKEGLDKVCEKATTQESTEGASTS